MKNLLSVVGMIFSCLCVGTVFTLILVTAVVWPKLKLDRERVLQIVAIARGADYMEKTETKSAVLPDSDQPSYQEILDARSVKFRNLELREQQLRNNLVQIQLEEGKLADEMKRQKTLADNFNAQLKALQESSSSAGMDDVGRTLQTIKPKQAKALLVEMLDKKEIDKVVVLLRQMPDKKRAAIIGEFKTNEEMEKMDEVLRRLREGQPEIGAAENAQAQMETKKLP